MNKKTLKIRPYARLLTMLGDQLIKNEQIALIELIKNAYDADADWVKVSLENFGNNLEVLANSKIIIEDNGEGMSLNTIEKSWMNPATPIKFVKKGESKKTKKKKRIIQGEKGIGRFSMLKLGKKILITTRPENSDVEFEIDYDFSAYDNDFLTEKGEGKELFIDDLNIEVRTKKPAIIVDKEISVGYQPFNRGNHGTRIEISNLKGKWNEKKIENIYNDISKLESIFDIIFKKNKKNVFTVGIYTNGKRYSLKEDYIEKLSGLFDTKAVFKIYNGGYSSLKKEFTFLENGIPKSMKIDTPIFKKNRVFRDRFCILEKVEENIQAKCIGKYRTPECGDFSFNFIIFDFDKNAPAKYLLDDNDRQLIKQHRIYLYRDGIRVFPYGDPEDDWLKIDTYRGTISAGQFFSNDQVVGWIEISKAGNPKLKDKTNREGLIDEGDATQDFTTLIQSFLSYFRLHQFKQYQENNKDKIKQDIFKTEEVKRQYEEIKKHFRDNPIAINAINDLYKTYSIERKYLTQRVEATEDLASVGLSVETASHDLMLMLSKGILRIDDLMKDCMGGSITIDRIIEELQKLRGIFSFIETQMKDIQLLFRSSKQRRRNIRVDDILQKVIRIYKNTLTRAGIKLEIEKIGSPLIAKCTDAVLLQLFINLFDNSIFWLTDINIKEKIIIIKLDGNNRKLIFSDNGPGISKEDVPYIFEAFYTSKEEGRGLGLYIARQLLERIDYSIWLADIKADMILSGANFVVSFVKQGE
ncbi:ATP-binding protein [Patescibacteria group bacterium]|nr:ATP-binding protein [Patescibacteria group bacterium]